tara:strand:+ start:727 stop:846 length:120 start_codon:yes stop_codon:yes gene_type:complete
MTGHQLKTGVEIIEGRSDISYKTKVFIHTLIDNKSLIVG